MNTQRYFLSLSYKGTNYCGWQIQPNDPSVQETLESAIGTILNEQISVTGCGRTDTGVHASYYVAHFDTEQKIPARFLNSLNGVLPKDIAVSDVKAVDQEAHARFSAEERAYIYHITFKKDPFLTETAWFYPQYKSLNLELLQEVADTLSRYTEFFPFCKSNSGLDNYRCTLKNIQWEVLPDEQGLKLHISANRFLRGMVRLIVGACIQTAQGKLTVQDIDHALQTQQLLPKNLSVPPQGLFLCDVKYPDKVFPLHL
ncbi:MAG: tRNA pseudouridine(38-40) synthase TruA [Saprospiraceae bacterium]